MTVTTTKTIIREHEADLLVQEAQTIADDVIVLTLADPHGAELPAWTPGAHIDLLLGDDLTRQYSLCSSPSKPDVWRVGVLRAPDSRGGSDLVHSTSRARRSVSAALATTFHWLPARDTCSSQAVLVADIAHDRGGRDGWRRLAADLWRPRTRFNGLS